MTVSEILFSFCYLKYVPETVHFLCITPDNCEVLWPFSSVCLEQCCFYLTFYERVSLMNPLFTQFLFLMRHLPCFITWDMAQISLILALQDDHFLCRLGIKIAPKFINICIHDNEAYTAVSADFLQQRTMKSFVTPEFCLVRLPRQVELDELVTG